MDTQANSPSPMRLSSDRNFGLVLTVFFTLIALAPLRHASQPRLIPLATAAVLLIVSLTYPRVLHQANLRWAYLGLLLHQIFSPIALGVLFFGVFTPLGFLYRLRASHPFAKSSEDKPSTYWIPRVPPGPAPVSLADQF